MRLSKEHKRILYEMGVDEGDFEQIEEATAKTIYELHNERYLMKRIGIREAIMLLGIKEFLSGISRSAFHWTSIRETKEKGLYVSFDSSPLFRG